jgi:hypothetical protein|eukprot:COSAG06_NODE_1486_length_9299_cov_3.915435_2_plen_89_part_00
MARHGRHQPPEPLTPLEIAWMVAKCIFAAAPLIAMAWFFMSASKRPNKKKTDGFVSDTVGNDERNAAVGATGFGGFGGGGGGTGLAHM